MLLDNVRLSVALEGESEAGDVVVACAEAMPVTARALSIQHEVDVFTARAVAREIAAAVGFPRVACLELEIAASELASNILKYGMRGWLCLSLVRDPARGAGLRLAAFDEGPPFQDFATAVKDGCDDAGPISPRRLAQRRGIGAGLGAVLRFTDALGWDPAPEGKVVWAVRFTNGRHDCKEGGSSHDL